MADWVAEGKFFEVVYAGPFIRRLLVYFLRLLDGELGSLAPGSVMLNGKAEWREEGERMEWAAERGDVLWRLRASHRSSLLFSYEQRTNRAQFQADGERGEQYHQSVG